MTESKQPDGRRPLIANNHRKRSLLAWVVPLLVVVTIMILLPRLVDLLSG